MVFSCWWARRIEKRILKSITKILSGHSARMMMVGVTQQWRFNKYYLNNQNIFRVYSCRRAEICDESSPRKGDSGHLFIKVFKHLSTNQSTGVKMNFVVWFSIKSYVRNTNWGQKYPLYCTLYGLNIKWCFKIKSLHTGDIEGDWWNDQNCG